MREQCALIWNGLLDVIYPPRCLVCGVRQEEALCALCRGAIAPIPPPFCDRCGVPVPAGEIVCAACAVGPEPPFAWSQALGAYHGPLRRAIHRLKYDGKTALALPLGRLLAASLDNPPTLLLPPSHPADHPAFDVVVPVPLHPTRLCQRGFNQAERIAYVLAQERNWTLDSGGLRRIRPTRSQTSLAPADRAANVQGAFVARTPFHFANQSVLLVDDVLTTMATVREAARVLKEAGAARVCVVALARGG
ncbi:MAG TPA: ComF family protein [Chthonomonadaceae bacterium]|nr:ComF family protein [Chthonomonadaceae bacterium]